MKKITPVEVRCECTIPFHQELVSCLTMLLSGELEDAQLPKAVPHLEAIREALQSKMVFIRIRFTQPFSKWRRRLGGAIRKILGKELVGTIRAGDGVTLIML